MAVSTTTLSRRRMLAGIGTGATLVGVAAAVSIPAVVATDHDAIADLIGADDARRELAWLAVDLPDEDVAMLVALARRYREG